MRFYLIILPALYGLLCTIRQPFTSISLISIPTSMSLINLNGKLLNEAKATISINNRSFRYGDGCFETIRITAGKIPLWQYHWERLSAALQTLQFQPPHFFTATYVLEQIITLAQKNGHQQLGRIRLTIFRGNGGLYDPENHFPNYLIQTWPLNDAHQKLNNNGLVVGLYDGVFKAADGLANIKSNNYLLYAMAAIHAKQQHWNDALILNHKGSIADTTIANLFIIKGNTITTPPLTDGPVAGTLRRYLLEKGQQIGFTMQEASVSPEEVLMADEVFLSNAIYGIKWVKQLGEKEYGFQQSATIFQKAIKTLFSGD